MANLHQKNEEPGRLSGAAGRWIRRGKWPSLVWGLAILATLGLATLGAGRASERALVLLDPDELSKDVWQEEKFGPLTRYRSVFQDGRAAVEAAGESSASGLIREVHFLVRDFPLLEWSWRVDRMAASSDIRDKARDDYGASLIVIFGMPGWTRPEPFSLTYAWTSAATPKGAVIPSPRRPKKMRVYVLRSGETDLGKWVTERRNLIDDFHAAFGHPPPEAVEALAIWSDSDQTTSQVLAYYGQILALPPGS
jgi:hypothetical protein